MSKAAIDAHPELRLVRHNASRLSVQRYFKPAGRHIGARPVFTMFAGVTRGPTGAFHVTFLDFTRLRKFDTLEEALQHVLAIYALEFS